MSNLKIATKTKKRKNRSLLIRRETGHFVGQRSPRGNHIKGMLPTPSYIEHDGRITHAIVPIDEYKRLVQADMIKNAVAKLDAAGKTEWVDPDGLALELAGKRIAEARKAAGLTQKQLADKLDLPQSQISRIERHPDHTTVRTLKRLAHALGVDVSALV